MGDEVGAATPVRPAWAIARRWNAGEESASASFLSRDGSAWSADKDGLIMSLLAAEITARLGRDPGERYEALTERFGRPVYRRVDAPAGPAQ